MDGGLFLATADAVEDRIREVALSTPGITGIVVDFEGVNFIDSQGAAKVSEIVELCQQAGVELRIAHIKPPVRDLTRRSGQAPVSSRSVPPHPPR